MTDGATPAVPGDDKNWPWVLERRCPDCGFAGPDVEPASVGGRLCDAAAA